MFAAGLLTDLPLICCRSGYLTVVFGRTQTVAQVTVGIIKHQVASITIVCFPTYARLLVTGSYCISTTWFPVASFKLILGVKSNSQVTD